MCREEDFDDEPGPSLLETLVKKAQEMARSIRSIKKTHCESKIDKINQINKIAKSKLKNKNGKKRTSSPTALKPDVIESKKLKNQKTYDESNLDFIKNKFDSFGETSEDELKGLDEFGPMKKITSNVIEHTTKNRNAFDMDNPERSLIHRRDRTQSENDTELVFNCEKASSSHKEFTQRQEVNTDSSDEEKKRTSSDEGMVNDEIDHTHSDESDENDTNETSRSPPIKRTMSLPRIKILEKQSSLPKICEEDEDDLDMGMSKESTGATPKTGSELSASVPIERVKYTVPKITRQHSEELKEIKLKDSPYDEDFFYYLDLYLDEAIKKIAVKNNKLVLTRNRSQSEAL